VKLPALSEAKGSELRNCPLYVREWITREESNERAPIEAASSSNEGHP
jgi:hypothetical protein